MNTLIPVILGSAAIGALVSSCITILGQWGERRSRRQELVLAEAVKLGQAQMDAGLRAAAANTTRPTTIVPMYQMVVEYHKWLSHLLETGEVHPEYVWKGGKPRP